MVSGGGGGSVSSFGVLAAGVAGVAAFCLGGCGSVRSFCVLTAGVPGVAGVVGVAAFCLPLGVLAAVTVLLGGGGIGSGATGWGAVAVAGALGRTWPLINTSSGCCAGSLS